MTDKPHPVSMKDIAEKTGFSKSAVSLALNNKGRLCEASRKKIQKAAREMGWRASPLVSETMRAARISSFKGYRETIACIMSPSWQEERTDPLSLISPEIRSGMEKAVGKFECHLNYFNSRVTDWEKLDSLFIARGIRRVACIGALPPELENPSQNKAHLDKHFLDRYAMVFNTWHEARDFPGQIVRTDMFDAGKMAFIKAWRAGYRRMIIHQTSRYADIEGRFEAGLRFALRGPFSTGKIEYAPYRGSRRDFEKVAQQWFDTLSSDTCLIGDIESGLIPLLRARLQKPDPPGVIDLKANISKDADFSGVSQNDYEIGFKMVESVLAQPLIHRHELRSQGGHQLVSPIWHEGDSLPVRKCREWNLLSEVEFDTASNQRMVCLNEAAPFPLECCPPERPCGGNEMAFPPAGECLFHGIPFFIGGEDNSVRYCAVGDPDQHRQADHAPAPPASVEMAVGKKAQSLYFLHAATRVTERNPIARYRFHYRSKKPIEVPVIPYGMQLEVQSKMRNTAPEVNIHDWYYLKGCMANRDTKPVCLINNYDPDHTTGYLYVWRWANPFPKSEITKIELLAEPGQEAVVLLFGVTAGMR